MSGETARVPQEGPVERTEWPTRLRAHVVEPAGDPRVHGYASQADLACHYGFAELLLLSMTGELPDERCARALEVVLVFLAPLDVSAAPVHAACLSRLCGATTSGTLGISAIALAEQARHALDDQADVLAWLENQEMPFPARHRALNCGAVARLRLALAPTGIEVPALDCRPSLTSALLATLFAIGLRRREQLELVFLIAQLPATAAEAGHVEPLAFRSYPMNTPAFRYEAHR